ncbi:hypothetical protein WG66_002559, partial [Moniliophthora roreri]
VEATETEGAVALTNVLKGRKRSISLRCVRKGNLEYYLHSLWIGLGGLRMEDPLVLPEALGDLPMYDARGFVFYKCTLT